MTSCEAFWSGSWDLGEVERSVIPPESFQKKTSKKSWWQFFFGTFSSNASNLRWGVFVRSFAADFLHHSCEGSEVHDYHSTFFNFSLENEWERWNLTMANLQINRGAVWMRPLKICDTHLWNVDACSEENKQHCFLGKIPSCLASFPKFNFFGRRISCCGWRALISSFNLTGTNGWLQRWDEMRISSKNTGFFWGVGLPKIADICRDFYMLLAVIFCLVSVMSPLSQVPPQRANDLESQESVFFLYGGPRCSQSQELASNVM